MCNKFVIITNKFEVVPDSNFLVKTYLNQSTFVLGCGNMTYTEEADPDRDFCMSGGHIMNGWGTFEAQVGTGYYIWDIWDTTCIVWLISTMSLINTEILDCLGLFIQTIFIYLPFSM